MNALRSFHARMVKLDGDERNRRIVHRKYSPGIELKASFVNVGTGEVLSDVIYRFKGDVTLYFIASDRSVLGSWHYIVSDGGCSCEECNRYGFCGHLAEVKAYIYGLWAGWL